MNRPLRLAVPLVCLLAAALACGGGGGGGGGGTQGGTPDPAPGGGTSGGTEARGEPKTPLEVLLATSGTGVEAVIDGDEKTSWKPAQDPNLEGVLLRFDEPLSTDEVGLFGCATEGRATVYIDGNEIRTVPLAASWSTVSLDSAGDARSVFVKLEGPPGVCLAEVSPRHEGAPSRLAPPEKVRGKIETSSVLQPEAAYRAAYLFDGRTHYGWVEGDPGEGVGEWVTVTLDAPRKIDALDVWNGYQRSDDHFQKNGRLARIRLTVDGSTRELDVKDVSGEQTLRVDPPLEGKQIRIDVLGVNKGSKYKDLVISELRFRDGEHAFGIESDAMRRAEDELRSKIVGTPLEHVVGLAWKSLCQPELGTFKLRADSSFVWYSAGAPDDDLEILDGAWALEDGPEGWGQIELYARYQLVRHVWEPYGSGSETETSSRVSGGQLQIARAADLGRDRLPAALKSLAGSTGAARIDCAKPKEMVEKGAILVKGKALTDVLVPAP